MPTPATDVDHTAGRGLGAAAKHVAAHASALAELELELAALELKRKLVALGLGIGLALAAAVLLLFALGFGLATAAAALATTVDTWLALLIVTGALLLIAVLLAVLALSRIRKGTPPVPNEAIAEAKLTTAAIRSYGAN